MTKSEQNHASADLDDLGNSLSFALRFEGRKSKHDSDRLNAHIVAQRLVRYLDKAGDVVMKKPPLGALSGCRGLVSATSRPTPTPC